MWLVVNTHQKAVVSMVRSLKGMLPSPSFIGESVVDFLRLLYLVGDKVGDLLGLGLRCGLVIGDF
jgi:hypothetical protein